MLNFRNRKVPTMPKKEMEDLLVELRELLKVVKMEQTDFGENTDFIREKTFIWRKSWLIIPLEGLIKRYKDAGYR